MDVVTGVIPNRLARGFRPGRHDCSGPVPKPIVAAWCDRVQDAGIRSIICLLSHEQLELYADIPDGLLGYYRSRGFEVVSLPVEDYKEPPLDDAELEAVWEAYCSLTAPVLVHCSAGMGRTGAAIAHILAKLDKLSGWDADELETKLDTQFKLGGKP